MSIERNCVYNCSAKQMFDGLNDGEIDLIVTSPPYDDLRDYHGFKFDFNETANLIKKKLKKGGVCIWNVSDKTGEYTNYNDEIVKSTESLTSFRQAIAFFELGFSVDTMIFNKNNYVPVNLDSKKYAPAFEYIFVLVNGGGEPTTTNMIKINCQNAGKKVSKSRYAKNGDISMDYSTVNSKKIHSNVFTYQIGNGNSDDKTHHPATFPESFAQDMIYTYSNEGDLVVDCFGGSFTTAKMAILAKRDFITSELSKEYCNDYVKRLNHYAGREIKVLR